MDTPIAALTLQDVCALLTAAAAIVTAFVVGWYTYITATLQRTAQKQVEVSAEQLAQAREQFEHEKSEIRRKQKQEVTDARPMLRWTVDRSESQFVRFEFVNAGGDFFDVKVIRDASANLTIKPDGIIRRDEFGTVMISALSDYGMSFPYPFSIEGKTRFSEWIEYRFHIEGRDRTPTLLEEKVLRDGTCSVPSG